MPSWVERKLKSSQIALDRAWLEGVEKYNILSILWTVIGYFVSRFCEAPLFIG